MTLPRAWPALCTAALTTFVASLADLGNPVLVGRQHAVVTRDVYERAVSAGCDDFLSKPVNKLELLKRVENMLRLRHVTDEVERLRRYIEGVENESGPAQ